MSAIGDYVHYTLYGYKGIGIRRHPYIYDLPNSLKQTRNMVRREIDKMNQQKIAKELQDTLNRAVNLYNVYSESEQQALYEQAFQEGAAILQQALGSDILVEVQEGVANRLQLSSSSGSRLTYQNITQNTSKNGSPTRAFKAQILKQNLRKYVKEIHKRLKLLGISINDKPKDVSKTYKECLMSILNIADQLQKDGRDLIKYNTIKGTNTRWKNNTVVINGKQYDLYKTGLRSVSDKINSGNVLNIVAGLMQDLNGKLISTEAIGMVTEEFVPAMINSLSNQIENKIKDTTEDVLGSVFKSGSRVGNNATQKAYRNSLFSVDLDMREVTKDSKGNRGETKSYRGENYTISFNSMPTKDKADIEITLRSGESIYINAKNANEQASKEFGIQIVGETPLLYLIQSYNTFDFVNHYLNITTLKNASRMQLGRKRESLALIEKTIDAVHKELKEIVLISALSQLGATAINGNITGYPGFFLFRETYGAGRDHYKDQFRVVTIYELFWNLMGNPDAYIDWGTTFDEIYVDPKEFGGVPSMESYSEYARARITWILQELHKRKISVHIRHAAIKKFLKNEEKLIPGRELTP